MSKAAVVRFADKILQHFPPYRWDEGQEKAWAADMVAELEGVPDEVIERASKEMVRTRRKEKTPLISECIEACSEAKRWIEAEANKGKLKFAESQVATGPLDWTTERLKLATDLATNRNDPLCVQAAKEGWIGSLWNFVRTNSRLPKVPAEVEACKREAREFDEAYKLAIRLQPEELKKAKEAEEAGAIERMFRHRNNAKRHKSLEEIGTTMLRKRHALADRVLRK